MRPNFPSERMRLAVLGLSLVLFVAVVVSVFTFLLRKPGGNLSSGSVTGQPTIVVEGRSVPVQLGKKYRILYYTVGTQNPRPRTPAEEVRYAELQQQLKADLSEVERGGIFAELNAIHAETASITFVENVVWLPLPGQGKDKDPPDSEAVVIDLR